MEIKFRGKRLDSSEWVVGHLIGTNVIVGDIIDWNDEYFNTEFWYKVDQSTVGEYIGKNDNKGNELWTGDIVDGRGYGVGIIKFGVHSTLNNDYYTSEAYGYYVSFKNKKDEYSLIVVEDYIVKIGNIHDNKELLESDRNAHKQ